MSREKCYRPKAAFPNHKDRVDIRTTSGPVCICMDCGEQVFGPDLSFDDLGKIIETIVKQRNTARLNFARQKINIG